MNLAAGCEPRWSFERQHQLAPHLKWDEAAHHGDAYATYAWGCTVAEVEIDPETGVTRLLRYLCVDDYGALVNPARLAWGLKAVAESLENAVSRVGLERFGEVGDEKYDIEFKSGQRVVVAFKEKVPIADVKRRVLDRYPDATVVSINVRHCGPILLPMIDKPE